MAKHAFFATRLGAILYRRRIDKLLGYPLRGTHVGRGPHVPMPDTWDGTGATPPGWTRKYARVRKHSTLAQWAVLANGEITAALADARAARLTGPELTAVQASVTGATEPDATWDTATEDDDP